MLKGRSVAAKVPAVDRGAVIGRGLALAGAAALALAFASPAAAAVPFTWTGAATAPNFSNTSNWSSASPLSDASSLTFGALPAPCAAGTTAPTCYDATNDVAGVSVDSISFDDSAPYLVQGDPISLGAGGFTATDSHGGFAAGWLVPLTLTANQTWSISGPLDFGGSVTGTGAALTVDFSTGPSGRPLWFLYNGDSELGPVRLTGPGLLQFGSSGVSTTLNGGDGHPVSLANRADLFLEGPAEIGPLSSADASIGLSTRQLTDTGGLNLDAHSSFSALLEAPGPGNFGTLNANGAVGLAGTLDLEQVGSGGPGTACSPLPAGTVFTILSAGGALSGAFANAPAGAELPTFIGCSSGGKTTFVKIGYTAHAMTATVVEGPSAAVLHSEEAAVLKPKGKHAKIGSLLKHGYTFSWPQLGPGELGVYWYAKHHRKQVLIAVVNANASSYPKTAIFVKLSKAGKQLLKHASKLTVRASDLFEPYWGAPPAPEAHATFTLKR